MTSLRSAAIVFVVALTASGGAAFCGESSPSSSPGYVDESMFRALVDENQDVVEINLDGPMLQALAKSGKDGDHDDDAKDVFAKLKSIHALIGTVKGPAQEALALVQKTDRKLAASGWQRVTRITDESSTILMLTHTAGDKIDGLVVLIFDSGDKQLVFANLAGEIDITKLGEIGDRFNVPGLDQVPGAR